MRQAIQYGAKTYPLIKAMLLNPLPSSSYLFLTIRENGPAW